MAKYVSLVAAVITACLLLYFYPLASSYEMEDNISYNIAYKATTTFVDAVRNKGYITPAMYNEFADSLGLTGNLYEIEMEHQHKRYNPTQPDPANPGTFRFDVYYDAFYSWDIMARLFPDNNLGIHHVSRQYRLTVGDYFSVSVKNKNYTKATLLRDFLNSGNTGDPTRIYIPYGGMVYNEDY